MDQGDEYRESSPHKSNWEPRDDPDNHWEKDSHPLQGNCQMYEDFPHFPGSTATLHDPFENKNPGQRKPHAEQLLVKKDLSDLVGANAPVPPGPPDGCHQPGNKSRLLGKGGSDWTCGEKLNENSEDHPRQDGEQKRKDSPPRAGVVDRAMLLRGDRETTRDLHQLRESPYSSYYGHGKGKNDVFP